MGTKNQPGDFDCYANADPNEPMFVLLGRDKHAPFLVEVWALLRHFDGEDEAMVAEALDCADTMRTWLHHKGKKECDNPVLENIRISLTEGQDEHPPNYESACACDLCKSYA